MSTKTIKAEDEKENPFITKPKEFRINGRIYIRCIFCKEKKEKHKIEIHYRVHTNEKPFKCSKCQLEFRYEKTCKRHFSRCRPTKQIICTEDNGIKECKISLDKLCAKNITNANFINKTLIVLLDREEVTKYLKRRKKIQVVLSKNSTNKEAKFQPIDKSMNHELFKKICYFCNQDIGSLRMTRHLRIHTHESPYQCSHCGMEFLRSEYLGQHQLRDEEVHKDFKLKCSQCDRFFKSNSQLERHSSIHWRISSTFSIPCICSGCVVKRENPHLLQGDNHCIYASSYSTTQNQNPPEQDNVKFESFECETCGKLFTNYSAFTRHCKMHRGKRKFKCPTCGKAFTRNSYLRIHIKIHTDRKRTFQCQTCGRGFFEKSKLKNHSLIHAGERRFSCSTCGRAFLRKADLEAHTLIHVHKKLRNIESPTYGKNNSFLKKQCKISTNRKSKFKCQTCGMAFTKNSILIRHCIIHTDRKRDFKCQICGRGFFDNYKLQRHSLTHRGGRSVPCTENPGIQNPGIQKEDLYIYAGSSASTTQNQNPPEKDNVQPESLESFECKTCGKIFTNNSSLIRHCKIHTNRKRTFKCQTCGQCFFDQGKLKRHSLIHTGERPFSCSTCGRAFLRKADLKVHTLIHVRNQQLKIESPTYRKNNSSSKKHFKIKTTRRKGQFKCQTCGKSFIRKFSLKIHSKIHTDRTRTFQCQICGRGFFEKNKLKRHSMIHTREQSFPCKDNPGSQEDDPCIYAGGSSASTIQNQNLPEKGNVQLESFECQTNNSSLISHSKIHTDRKMEFTCQTCGKIFIKKSTFQKHCKIHTDPKRTFKCQTCGRGFVRKATLQEHSMTHTGERPFACSTCGRAFIRKRDLNTHALIHDRNKLLSIEPPNHGKNNSSLKKQCKISTNRKSKFECQTCGKIFTKNSSFIRHCTIHTDRKREFICQTCGRGFFDKYKLQRHSLTHKEKRPFPCSKCDKAYLRKDHLKHHITTIHAVTMI